MDIKMTTLENVNANVKNLSALVRDIHTKNQMRNNPVGDIHGFVENSKHISGESEQMFNDMIANLGAKYANLKRETKKKDVVIHSMEKVILDLNGGKLPDDIQEYINHFEADLKKHKEESKKHCDEKLFHQHSAEVLECQHVVKDKIIDKHEERIVDQKARLVDTHIMYNEHLDDQERQIDGLQLQVEQLKKKSAENVDPSFEKHIMNNAQEAVEEVIDHYEQVLERVSKENLDKDIELANHKWTIEEHETNHYHKDNRIQKHKEQFEDHSQILKEYIMQLQLELSHKDFTISKLKAGTYDKNTEAEWQADGMADMKLAQIKQQVEKEMEKLNALLI